MILAPMQGLTEAMFRRVYERCFPGAIALAVSPFLSLTHNISSARGGISREILEDVLPEANVGSMPVVPQILGKEPGEFVALCAALADLGYKEVNWNMGCPVRKVVGKRRGSGLLPHPDLVRSVLDAVVPAIGMPMSVKVRLGLKETHELFDLIPVLNDYPLASVTIHPRLGRQQYSGQVDLDTFGQALPLIKHPVIYNGDITTADFAHRIRERFPEVADIMLGRGVLYNPLLPLDILQPGRDRADDPARVRHFIRSLIAEIRTVFPTEQAQIRKTKEYWCLLWKSLPITELQARQVLRQEKLTDVDNLIASLLQ